MPPSTHRHWLRRAARAVAAAARSALLTHYGLRLRRSREAGEGYAPPPPRRRVSGLTAPR